MEWYNWQGQTLSGIIGKGQTLSGIIGKVRHGVV